MEKLLKEIWKRACKAQRKVDHELSIEETNCDIPGLIYTSDDADFELPYLTEADRIMKFIEFHELETVQSLKKPLTREDAVWLLSRYPVGVIESTLLDMENFPKLKKKYKSVKLTLNNWCKKRMQQSGQSGNNNRIKTQYA